MNMIYNSVIWIKEILCTYIMKDHTLTWDGDLVMAYLFIDLNEQIYAVH